MTDIAAAAIKLAYAGHPVIPLHSIGKTGRCSCGRSCASPGKHPRTGHGLKDASADPSVVAAWWRRWKLANVGLLTGEVADLLVVDLDGEEGIAAFDLLVAEHGLPTTRWAATGGGGRHVYFRHPGGALGNSCRRLGAGIDTRGDNGYVLAPPSNHVTGSAYSWMNQERAAPCPPWVVELLRPPAPPSPAPIVRTGRSRVGYGAAALAMEEATVRMAVPGCRNATLNSAAFNLGQLVGGGLLELDAVAGALLVAALASGLGETEAMKTIESGLRAGQGCPRGRTA